MDSEKCRTLLCVLDAGSFSAAAAILGYTPSGVSRMIAALETELGFGLFVREHGGVKPTAECSLLLPSLREFDRWGRRCTETAADIRGLNVGVVTVGTAYSACYVWLSELIADFRKKYPNIEVRIVEGSSSELCEAMERHRADICLISRRDGDFRWMTLVNDPLTAWVPAASPLAKLNAFPVSAFETEPVIEVCPGQDTDGTRILDSLGLRSNTKYTSTESNAAFSMVAAGLGVCLNNNLNARGRKGAVAVLPLDPPQIISIGLAIPKSLSPAAKKLAEFAAGRDFAI